MPTVASPYQEEAAMRTMISIVIVLVGLGILSPQSGTAEVETLWKRRYGYATSGAWMWGGGPSVEQTRDGGFIVATGESNLRLVKTDGLGGILWTQVYDLPCWASSLGSVSIQQLHDGGYVLCGSLTFEMGIVGGLLMRFDAAGDSLWTECPYDIKTCVQQTVDDGFIIAGWRQGGCTFGERATLTKTDGEGNVEWSREWPEYTGFNHLVRLRDGGGYAMTGWRMTESNYQVYFVKSDLDGIEVASGIYGGEDADYDWGSETYETSDDGFVICGQLDKSFAYLIRTDAVGDTLWTRKYGPPLALAHSVVETSCGNFLAVGQRSGQAWILETDSAGDTLWSETYDIFGDAEFGRRIRPAYDGSYIMAGGGKAHPDSPYYLFLRRLEESISEVTSPEVASPSAVHLQPNVPNPFGPTTTIRYYIPEPGNVLLQIHDSRGRLVRTLVQAPRPTGTHVISWDGTSQAGASVACGVYFYRLKVNGEIQTRRMVLGR